mmetsp:Transcript_148028/g.258165  ORF Transcript_148028/g.258165 Transcript_148028/m.258165 type:complete len:200 (-) Transcript_148028:80-679(-)
MRAQEQHCKKPQKVDTAPAGRRCYRVAAQRCRSRGGFLNALQLALLMLLPRHSAAVRGLAVPQEWINDSEYQEEEPQKSCCGICSETPANGKTWLNGTPEPAFVKDPRAWTAVQAWPVGDGTTKVNYVAGKVTDQPRPQSAPPQAENFHRWTTEAWMQAWSQTGSGTGFELTLFYAEVMLAVGIVGLNAVLLCRHARQE